MLHRLFNCTADNVPNQGQIQFGLKHELFLLKIKFVHTYNTRYYDPGKIMHGWCLVLESVKNRGRKKPVLTKQVKVASLFDSSLTQRWRTNLPSTKHTPMFDLFQYTYFSNFWADRMIWTQKYKCCTTFDNHSWLANLVKAVHLSPFLRFKKWETSKCVIIVSSSISASSCMNLSLASYAFKNFDDKKIKNTYKLQFVNKAMQYPKE